MRKDRYEPLVRVDYKSPPKERNCNQRNTREYNDTGTCTGFTDVCLFPVTSLAQKSTKTENVRHFFGLLFDWCLVTTSRTI